MSDFQLASLELNPTFAVLLSGELLLPSDFCCDPVSEPLQS